MQPIFNALLFAGLLAGVTTMNAADPEPGAYNQVAKHFAVKQKRTVAVDYLLQLPKGYDAKAGKKAGKKYPLICFLHGAGERGANVWQVAKHGPAKRAVDDPAFPFIVVSPQCPAGQIWSRDALLLLLDEVMKAYPVDPSRVYLTGLSMGGYGSWDLALAYPERFAAVAPICGGGEMITVLLSSREKVQALKSLGVWAFHGAKDPIVMPSESERMVEALKKVGVTDLKYTLYPEAGHDSWTETYKNPEFYTWLLQHKR
jgi:predicted peptidase